MGNSGRYPLIRNSSVKKCTFTSATFSSVSHVCSSHLSEERVIAEVRAFTSTDFLEYLTERALYIKYTKVGRNSPVRNKGIFKFLDIHPFLFSYTDTYPVFFRCIVWLNSITFIIYCNPVRCDTFCFQGFSDIVCTFL